MACWWVFLCVDVAGRLGFSPGAPCARVAPNARLISAKIRWILPKSIKESVDLPDFVKESVSQTQVLCTFQADFETYLKLPFHGA